MVRSGEHSVRLIHTADWQIGKVFRFVDEVTMHVLQEARLDAIATIGRLAMQHGVGVVLVAGDIYDKETLSNHTLAQPLERMRAWPRVNWHMIPGNHDPHRPNGVWERVLSLGVPDNVHVQLSPAPYRLEDGFAYLLPAPLRLSRGLGDPTLWMDTAPTPDGAIRIGLAHGSIADFGGSSGGQPNVISPLRAADAELAYLALGDWHGCRQVNQRSWYAGTPEPDQFGQVDSGQALLVTIDAPRATPTIKLLQVGRYRWRQEQATVHGQADVDRLVARLRNADDEPSRALLDLKVDGTLSLADREHFERMINQSLRAALCHLRLDDQQLLLTPSLDDLDGIARHGVIRAAAERLKALVEAGPEDQRPIAELALVKLYLESRKLGAMPGMPT